MQRLPCRALGHRDKSQTPLPRRLNLPPVKLTYKASLLGFYFHAILNVVLLATAATYPAVLPFWPFTLHWLIRHVVQGVKVEAKEQRARPPEA